VISMDWCPRKSLGPFVLGDVFAASPFYSIFSRADSLSVGSVHLVSYVMNEGELRIEVKDGKIESVSSEKTFIYNESNFIGMALSDVESILGVRADEIDVPLKSDEATIADFSDLGLQIVINDGRITSATCY
jgi:hypothetical protein